MHWRLTRIGRGGTAHLVTVRRSYNGRVITLCGFVEIAPKTARQGDPLCLNCTQTLQELNVAMRELTAVPTEA